MRCVYCKMPSGASKSVDHVVPESLGNHTLVLRAGLVCDACNNYFSREVEGPFLNAPWTKLVRHEQALPSKRGRIPSVRTLAPGVGGATMHAAVADRPGMLEFDSNELARRWLLHGLHRTLLTEQLIVPPSPTVTSRFLGKVAIGCLADRLAHVDGGLEYLVDEVELDRLRNHVRRGTDSRWPVSIRRIYPANARWREGSDLSQKVWELDMFHDDDGYLYSVLVIFGVEFVIHLGEPDISGYHRWLLLHAGESPLYTGRYASEKMTRDGSYDVRGKRIIVGSRP